MARASKTFRIFVSSTFSDMKEERNALQEWVYPGIRDRCMQHGCRFQVIDLRWGVAEEASADQQTMKICFEVDSPLPRSYSESKHHSSPRRSVEVETLSPVKPVHKIERILEHLNDRD